MARRFLAIAFVLAALAPEAFVSAQQSSQSAATHSAATHSAASATNSKSSTTVSARHSAPPNMQNRHHSNVPPWSNSVYVNGGSAAQYLATPKPKPPPPKNKVNTNGEVFKSISN
jgi:hypothetical protein